VPAEQIQQHRTDLEDKVMTELSMKARPWGIELQYACIREIKAKKP
jgi:hypothetical protein